VKPTSRLPLAAIQSAQNLVKEHEVTTIANLHRTCSGITAFRVQDPDPNAVDGGNVLGIRFEIFSSDKRAFDIPYYVLFNQPNRDGRLRVHKHTVPVFVPLQTLVKRYLPFTTEDEDDNPKTMARAQQNLPSFVRALRKALVSHHKRLEAYRHLKQALEGKHGVEEVKMLDSIGNEIEMVFRDNIIARMRISTDGRIEKVAVGPSQTAGANVISTENSAKAYREIKKAIEGAGGRVDDLVERLQKRRRA
jgi:central kinetochore subunit Mal2/MCM21